MGHFFLPPDVFNMFLSKTKFFWCCGIVHNASANDHITHLWFSAHLRFTESWRDNENTRNQFPVNEVGMSVLFYCILTWKKLIVCTGGVECLQLCWMKACVKLNAAVTAPHTAVRSVIKFPWLVRVDFKKQPHDLHWFTTKTWTNCKKTFGRCTRNVRAMDYQEVGTWIAHNRLMLVQVYRKGMYTLFMWQVSVISTNPLTEDTNSWKHWFTFSLVRALVSTKSIDDRIAKSRASSFLTARSIYWLGSVKNGLTVAPTRSILFPTSILTMLGLFV